jgi:hypothetical protein
MAVCQPEKLVKLPFIFNAYSTSGSKSSDSYILKDQKESI